MTNVYSATRLAIAQDARMDGPGLTITRNPENVG